MVKLPGGSSVGAPHAANQHTKKVVVYACACICMVENHEHSKIVQIVPFLSCLWEAHIRLIQKWRKVLVCQQLGVTPKCWLTPKSWLLLAYLSLTTKYKCTLFIFLDRIKSTSWPIIFWLCPQNPIFWLGFGSSERYFEPSLIHNNYVLCLCVKKCLAPSPFSFKIVP